MLVPKRGMRNRSLSLLLALALFISLFAPLAGGGPASASSDNLIQNPGFESGDLTAWEVSSAAAFRVDDAVKRTGSYALRVQGDGSYPYIRQLPINVEPNTEYKLSFYAKASGGSTQIEYRTASADSSNVALQVKTAGNASTEWTLYELTFNSGGYSQIRTVLKATALVYFDDVALTKVVPEDTVIPDGSKLVPPTDGSFRYFGRWDTRDNSNYTTSWAGTYVKVNFTGTTVQLKLGGSSDIYVRVDGVETFHAGANGIVNLTPEPLAPGTHTLMIASPYTDQSIQFQGLVIDEDATVATPGTGDKIIEFVGGSILAGYLLPKQALSDFAWLAPEALGYEHTQIAYTGINLVDNWSGGSYIPNKAGLSNRYCKLKNAASGDHADWDFSRYQADAVIINVGTNDKVFGVPSAEYAAAYLKFLEDIRAKYPAADIYAQRLFNGAYEAETLQSVLARQAAGDAKVHYIDTTGWLDAGDYIDGTHPNAAAHQKLAAKFAEVLGYSDSVTASQVSVSGTAKPGETLTGSYSYASDDSVAEGDSRYRWLISDTENGNYTAIEGENGVTLQLQRSHSRSYIQFEVTPRDESGKFGAAVRSVPVAVEAAETVESVFDNFITVSGDKLMDGDAEYRFATLNYPGGMRDSEFSQEDALRTIAAIGGKVTRTYVPPVKRYDDANADYALVLGPDASGVMQFNESGFRKLDNLLALANEFGVRLLIPFVDQWQWEGGIESYVNFRYPGTISNDAANDEDAWKFYTDAQVIADFKQVIHYMMNRVNTITGVTYKEDKAILAWETGNELGGYNQDKFPQSWTSEIARYIKEEIGPHQLLLDGRFAVHADSLSDDNIDIVGNHFYTGNFIDKINNDMDMARGHKPYILGEFGLYTKAEPVDALFQAALQNGAAGAMLWSLRPHKNDGGFFWHDENPGNWASYHWPGFSSGDYYDETNIIRTVYKYAHYMDANDRDKTTTVPPIKAPETTPVLFPIESVGNIKWRGSVGAAGYEVQRSENGTDWATVAASFSDGGRAGTPAFHDEQAITGTAYQYRVRGVNESGHSEWSNVVQTTARHIVTDELSLLYNDTEKRKVYAYDHSANLTTQPDFWNELGLAFKAFVPGNEYGYLTYGSPVPIHTLTVKTLGSGIPQFMASGNNGGFVPVAEGSVNVASDAEGKVYTLSGLPDGTRFVKLLVPGNAALRIDRVDLEYLYAGEAGLHVPLEAIQRSGFIVDSEFGEWPDGISDNLAVTDEGLASEDGNGGYVLYRTGGDINSYRVVSEEAEGAAPLQFSISLDGVHFTVATPAVQRHVGGEDSNVAIYSDFAVKTGTRYLKISFPSADTGAGAAISRVEIGYGVNMIPLTDKPPVNVLEDAEYYFGKDEALKAAYTRNANGDSIVPSIATAYKSNGNYGMKIDYAFGANDYAGLTKELENADLSAFDSLQAWVKGDGSGNKLIFQFRLADNSVWEAIKLIQGTEGQTIQVKYDEFVQPSWDTPVAGMDMSGVKEFSLYISSGDAATANAGAIYLDNIRVANSTKLDNYESYGGYDTLLQRAYSRNTGGGRFDVSLTGERKSEGSYGLKLDYDVAATGYAGATLSPNYLNLNGYDGFSMWFQPDDSRNKLVIQFTTEDGKYWETSTTIKGLDARLMYVPFSKFRHPGWYGGDPNATPDISKNIIAYSIYMNRDEGVTRLTSGTVYIDDINGASFEDRLANAEVAIARVDGAAVTTFPYTIEGTGPANEYVAIAVGKQKFYAPVNGAGEWSYAIPRMVNGAERVITAAVELYDETAIASDSVTVNVEVPGNTYQEETTGGGSEEPPVDETNYAINGGFEEVAQAGVWPLLPQGWNHVDADGVAVTDGKVKLEGNARTGAYKLVHYNAGPYEAVSSQTVTGLREGIYEVTAWTQSKAGNPQLAEMTVRSGDGEAVAEVIEPGEGVWVKRTITNVEVKTGALTISFRSKSAAGDFWIAVDDVALNRIGDINYVANGSFENFAADSASGALLPDHWVSRNEAGEPVTDGTAKVEASDSSRDGSYQLAHWNAAAYVVTTSQEVSGLQDGVYELRAWTRSKGGQTKAELTASGYGGATLSEAIEAGESTWVQQKISGIGVTAGKLVVGLHSDSPAGRWIVADAVELVRTGDLPDDGGNNGGENGGNNGNNVDGSGTGEQGVQGKLKEYSKQQLEAAVQNGGLTVTANEAGVRIPAEIAGITGDGALRVKAASAELVIPSKVLQQLAGLLPSVELERATIDIITEKLPSNDYDSLLAAAGRKRGAAIAAAGSVYEFILRIATSSGKATELTELAEPVGIKLLAGASRTSGFTGIYFIGDEGDIEYVGNLEENGYFVADVRHFSKYGILNYDKSFSDMPTAHWASPAVKELAAKGIVQGVTLAEFRPDDSVTRAQFTTMLVRALGLQASGRAIFTDVTSGSWYGEAVAAAAEYGIVHGRSLTEFAPNAVITREEMAVMLVRAYTLLGGASLTSDAGESDMSASFIDAGRISEWAKNAVQAAYVLGLMQGDDKGGFKPQHNATRAQSAQVVQRLVQ